MPYLATAMVGAGIRSFVAVSGSDQLALKVRYTVKTAVDDEAAIDAECKSLHRMTANTFKAIGQPDGPVFDGPADFLLDDRSSQSETN
jgi:hypothetical protein